MAVSGAAIASVQSASAPATAALATEQLRVVTANLAFRGPEAVRNDWNTIGPEADIVFVQEAKNAGVWVFGGGVVSQRASVVATDGTVTDGPYPETKEVLGGFAVVDVPSREEALEWAAKIAVACRCAQEVRELLPDPTV